MRYRITLEQVMETWYCTLTTWEPDGLKLEKHTRHLQFEVHPDYPDNIPIILSRLEKAYIESVF